MFYFYFISTFLSPPIASLMPLLPYFHSKTPHPHLLRLYTNKFFSHTFGLPFHTSCSCFPNPV